MYNTNSKNRYKLIQILKKQGVIAKKCFIDMNLSSNDYYIKVAWGLWINVDATDAEYSMTIYKHCGLAGVQYQESFKSTDIKEMTKLVMDYYNSNYKEC